MIKKQTGRKIDAKDFKLLNQCVECGYATNIKYGGKCPLCELLDRPKCRMCDIVLRDMELFFGYDHSNKLRDGQSVKISKKPIKEYIKIQQSPTKPHYEECLCDSCYNRVLELKNTWKNLICSHCGKRLDLTDDETSEYYWFDYLKKHGQLCLVCDDILSGNLQQYEEQDIY